MRKPRTGCAESRGAENEGAVKVNGDGKMTPVGARPESADAAKVAAVAAVASRRAADMARHCTARRGDPAFTCAHGSEEMQTTQRMTLDDEREAEASPVFFAPSDPTRTSCIRSPTFLPRFRDIDARCRSYMAPFHPSTAPSSIKPRPCFWTCRA
ncbi:hypothetical protein PMIN01_04641 [Paraphaeosphaeria minitans]|uniref:Uncharacterized protein n=1 Tax=Paraphaeosphaeria minitans TaxID=565426 RepID=A0A9P6GJG1_9PLEO|nr:hypothetical protein PMIN01_04641 [Paraphaeosphaeria minitans]